MGRFGGAGISRDTVAGSMVGARNAMTGAFERLPTLKQRDLAQLLPHNGRAPGSAAASNLTPAAAAA